MGKTSTPIYRIEFHDQQGKHTCAWQGKPTVSKLETWINSYHASLKPGGVNQHISKSLGFIPFAHKAFIIRQNTNHTVVTWRAPLFMIVE